MPDTLTDTPKVGQRLDGGTIIRVSELGVHEDDAPCVIITRRMDDDGAHTKYVSHLMNLSTRTRAYGDYTNDPIRAMKNHNDKVRLHHREDVHGPHDELR